MRNWAMRERLRARISETQDLLSNLIDDYVSEIDPKSVTEIRERLEEEFFEPALSHLLYALDNSVSAAPEEDDYFCADSYAEYFYADAEKARKIVQDSGCVTVLDVIAWIENKQREQDQIENIQ